MSGFYWKRHHRLLISALCVTCIFAVIRNVARADGEGDEGFVPLFNGKDLSGWQTKGNWIYEQDGVLAARPQGRRRLFPDPDLFLWSEATYDDFVLDLEFKVEANASSGVFLRSSSSDSYIQAQIRDSHGKGEPFGNSTCGAIVGVAAPSKNMSKTAGEWNRMIITCEGDRMQVKLNGEEIINLDLSKSEKCRDVHAGHIGFENSNTAVAFRSVRVKALKRK